MKIPRLRRLAPLAVGALLALVASTLAPLGASADPAPTSASAITVVKTLTAGPVANGGTVTATLTITGTSADPVVIEDYYDYGLTFVSSPSHPVECVNTTFTPSTHGRVVCTFPSIGSSPTTVTLTFTAAYVGPTVYSFWRTSDERMEIQKADNHVSLLEDEEKVVAVTCETGYHIMDFGFVKQWVDQDEGDLEHIRVVSTDVFSPREYRVRVKNLSTGQAQAKVYATCIRDTTNLGTTLSFGSLTESTTILHPQAPGEARPLYAHCPAGETPIAVDVRAVVAAAHTGSPYTDGVLVQHGLEADGGRRTRVWVEVLAPASVTLEWQCMRTTTSSLRPMQFELITGDKTVAANSKASKKLSCNIGYKGIVAGWEGGKINGTEPQPIARVFWFYNQSASPKTYDLSLLCLRNRLLKLNRLEIDTTVKEKLVNFASGVQKSTAHKWIVGSRATVNVDY